MRSVGLEVHSGAHRAAAYPSADYFPTRSGQLASELSDSYGLIGEAVGSDRDFVIRAPSSAREEIPSFW